jgi:hypothetical protein
MTQPPDQPPQPTPPPHDSRREPLGYFAPERDPNAPNPVVSLFKGLGLGLLILVVGAATGPADILVALCLVIWGIVYCFDRSKRMFGLGLILAPVCVALAIMSICGWRP